MASFMYLASRQFLRIAFRITGGLEVRGQDLVPPEGPLIVACNHASHLDPMILGAAFRRDLHFMARKTLFDIPVFSWLITQNQAFPLNREGDSRDALRAFGERLDKGYAVVMFPEGTRSYDGVTGEMKPGVGMLAVRNQAPVVPVYIWGSFQSWPRGKKFLRRHRLKCFTGPAIIPSAEKAERKNEQTRINEEVGVAIRRLEKEAWQNEPDIPQKLLDRWAAEPQE